MAEKNRNEQQNFPNFRTLRMKISTCFIVFNYLLTALGISCLILSETFSGTIHILLIAGIGICFVLEVKKVIPIPSPPQLSLWKIGILFLLLSYSLLNLPLLEILVAFLILILFTRLVFKTELNDYLYSYMISIVCLLVGAIYVQELVFGFLFLSFYMVLCWALILYNLMVERVGSRCPPHKFKHAGETETVRMSLFGLSASLVLISLLLTTVIFISFPRIGLGFISLGSESSPISGFSEKVTLGDVGKIKQNQEVVMRVEFTQGNNMYRPLPGILWRGVALDHFDGRVWSSTMRADWQYKNQPGSRIRLFSPGADAKIIRQNIYLEDFDSNIIFTHGVPITIDGTFRTLKMDQGFVLRTAAHPFEPRKYDVISDISHPKSSFGAVAPFTQDENLLARFLQLPELSPQIIQQAKNLAQFQESFTEKADNILKFLRTGFEYSLEMVKQTDETSIDEFLFHRKKGHCEYFASAMVILLRINGVPARIVNGFVGTEWNRLGNYMVVRQQNAHSWVEAFISGKGWTLYDPTPPDPSALNITNNPMSLMMDLIRLNWQRYVIRYSIRDQIKIVHFFRSEGQAIADQLKSLKSIEWMKISHYLKERPWWIILAACLYILINIWRKNGWIFSFTRQPPQVLAIILYKKMLHKLAKSGVQKSGHWTHREFLQHLTSLPPEKRRMVENITRFYEKSRFGNTPHHAHDRGKIQKLISQL